MSGFSHQVPPFFGTARDPDSRCFRLLAENWPAEENSWPTLCHPEALTSHPRPEAQSVCFNTYHFLIRRHPKRRHLSTVSPSPLYPLSTYHSHLSPLIVHVGAKSAQRTRVLLLPFEVAADGAVMDRSMYMKSCRVRGR